MPMYVLGLMGVHAADAAIFDDPSLQLWFMIAAFGAVLIACGIAGVPHPACGELSCGASSCAT